MKYKKQLSTGALIIVILLILFKSFMADSGNVQKESEKQAEQQVQIQEDISSEAQRADRTQETAESGQDGGKESEMPQDENEAALWDEAQENSDSAGEEHTDTNAATDENTEYTWDDADYLQDSGEKNTSGREADYETTEQNSEKALTFRNDKLLNQHYQKHGIEMGFSSAAEYEAAAAAVVANPEALHKTEAEDGDDVYYVESTNEFVIVSTDGYLRTYFYPNAGIKYFNRQ